MYHLRTSYDGIQPQPGQTSIGEDEPVFLLRGKDALAGDTVERWADLLDEAGGDPELADRVREYADEMRRYSEAHDGKIPDCDLDELKEVRY